MAVLLRVYAKCVAGQEEDAKRRISEATRPKPLQRFDTHSALTAGTIRGGRV